MTQEHFQNEEKRLKLQKKYYATNIKNIISFIALTTLLISSKSIAAAQTNSCSQELNLKIPAHENSGIEIDAKLCSNNSGTGLVTIDTVIGGKKNQRLEIPYSSSISVLNMENKIDLNKDGVYDLALSTGGGKSGEGYFYWIRDNRNHYHPIGDYPTLFTCKGESRILYSITPGSGEKTSTWTYYEETNRNINPILLIETSVSDDGQNELIALIPTMSGATLRLNLAESPTNSSINDYLESVCMTYSPADI